MSVIKIAQVLLLMHLVISSMGTVSADKHVLVHIMKSGTGNKIWDYNNTVNQYHFTGQGILAWVPKLKIIVNNVQVYKHTFCVGSKQNQIIDVPGDKNFTLEFYPLLLVSLKLLI